MLIHELFEPYVRDAEGLIRCQTRTGFGILLFIYGRNGWSKIAESRRSNPERRRLAITLHRSTGFVMLFYLSLPRDDSAAAGAFLEEAEISRIRLNPTYSALTAELDQLKRKCPSAASLRRVLRAN